MGLDGVELVMEVEKTFGVVIDDDTAMSMVTVGDMFEFLQERVPTEAQSGCLTQAAFYRLRKPICERLGVSRSALRPATPLDSALPLAGRREHWPKLGFESGLRLPRLRRAEWLGTLLVIITCGGMLFGLGAWLIGALAWSLAFGIAVFAGLLLAWCTTDLAVQIHLNPHTPDASLQATFGDLVRQVASDNRQGLLAQQRAWSNQEIWDTLVGLVSETLGVPRDKIAPSSRFVDDLGVG